MQSLVCLNNTLYSLYSEKVSRFAKDSLTSQYQQKENILALCWLGFLRHHCLSSHPWATGWLLLLTVCLE